MSERASFSREYWQSRDLVCRLNSEEGALEVTLTDERGLIALRPCRDYFEAAALASEWRFKPPRPWPDDTVLL